MPRHLLTINWADTGPGLSWPMAYHLTWVPLYDVFVVTQSADCPDVFGYSDFAIGRFRSSNNIVESAAGVVTADWIMTEDLWCQTPWAYVLGEGMIDIPRAAAMAEEVWGDELTVEFWNLCGIA